MLFFNLVTPDWVSLDQHSTKDKSNLLPNALDDPQLLSSYHGWDSHLILGTNSHGSQPKLVNDFSRGMSELVIWWKEFVSWWVLPQSSRMCSAKKCPHLPDGWCRSRGSSNRSRFKWIRKWLYLLIKDGSSVGMKSIVLNASNCFGISQLRVSKNVVLQWLMEG